MFLWVVMSSIIEKEVVISENFQDTEQKLREFKPDNTKESITQKGEGEELEERRHLVEAAEPVEPVFWRPVQINGIRYRYSKRGTIK